MQKCGAPPVIKIGIFSKERLEEEVDSRPARCVKKRNFRRAGIGDSIPILQAFDKRSSACVFGLRYFRRRHQLIREEEVGITIRVGLDFKHVLGA